MEYNDCDEMWVLLFSHTVVVSRRSFTVPTSAIPKVIEHLQQELSRPN